MRPRVILKKTSYLKRQERGNSKRISKYLEKYVDEVGKALAKNGEAPWASKGGKAVGLEEARWLLPKEKTGVFYTGGFLGDGESPGNNQPKKQKGWIRRFTSNWLKALEKHSHRRNDGFRFILGLSPQTVRELTACNISCDQAMREIWSTAMGLYRERHGWTSHADELAWLAGAHHDTDNAHLHIMLFPTTKSGKLLRTNNNRGKDKVNDLNDLIAMVNIAADIYYREFMPFRFQSQEFKTSLLNSPEEEPSLPSLEDFEIPSGIGGDRRRQRVREEVRDIGEEVQWNDIAPLDEDKKIEMSLEYGETSFLAKIKSKIMRLRGTMILGAMATIAKVWEKKKMKFFPTIKSLNSTAEVKEVLERLSSSFPEEKSALEIFGALESSGIIKRQKVLERLKTLTSSPKEAGHAIINMAIGLRKNVTDKEAQSLGINLLRNFENGVTDKDDEKKLELIEQEGNRYLLEKRDEDLRRISYQSIRRSILVNSQAKASENPKIKEALVLLDQMIEGSKKVSLSLEARYLEAKFSVERDEKEIKMRKQTREWSLEKLGNALELVVKRSVGKPWPPHLDPETVISSLKSSTGKEIPNQTIGKTTYQKTVELTKDENTGIKAVSDTNPLEIIINTKNRRNRERRRELRARLRSIRRTRDIGKEEIEKEIK